MSATSSEAATAARSTEHGLLLLQLYQIAIADRDGAQMRSVAQRFHAAPEVVAAFGAQLPAPGSDALALAYEGERRAEEGDDRGAAQLLEEALALATTRHPAALVPVLAARHEHALAAGVMSEVVRMQLAANASGDLGVGTGEGVDAALGSLPADVVASMLALQRRRTLVQGLAALVRLRDPAGAAPLLEELRASAGDGAVVDRCGRRGRGPPARGAPP